MDTSLIVGIWLTVVGLCFVVFSSRISRGTVEWHFRLLGIRFREKDYRIPFILAGSLLFVVGVLALFRVIRFKN